MHLDRRATVRLFRQRLVEAMEKAEVNRSQLAKLAGVDRSTLSQLLSEDNERLPRADTVAAVASVLQVSLDWLLGLTTAEQLGAAILRESVEVAMSAGATGSDDNLERWHREAVGQKVRYVPATLPDIAKTESVLRYEYADYSAKKPAQAIAAAAGKLAYTRMPESDFEICFSRQVLEGFARGEGIWSGLSEADRTEQLDHMAELADELYPRLRLFLFDGLAHYSVPYTVFGSTRAAVFLGEMFFVFNTREHVRMLSEHFDRLIRAAVVQAHDMPRHLAELARNGGVP